MKKSLFTPFIFVAILQWTCSNSPLGLGKDDSRDWVAMTARIKEYRQIVLVDFNDSSKYKILTDNEHQNIAPKFSHDKKLLVYEDKQLGTSHDSGLQLLDVASGIATRILHDKDPRYNMFGGHVVWGANDLNIYFSQNVFIGAKDILTYDFTSNSSRRLTYTLDYSEYPVGFKGADTLIVFSNDTVSTGQPSGFYFMDINGQYLKRINNPHLNLIKRNGNIIKAAFNPEWNNELGLFAFADMDSAYSGYRIAVSNLTGSYYKTYTNGEFHDNYPTWGPEGKTILFDRHKLSSYEMVYKVMIVDLETGEVREFVKPENIRGATSLMDPDY